MAETIERKGGRSEFFIGQRNGNSSPYLKKKCFSIKVIVNNRIYARQHKISMYGGEMVECKYV